MNLVFRTWVKRPELIPYTLDGEVDETTTTTAAATTGASNSQNDVSTASTMGIAFVLASALLAILL